MTAIRVLLALVGIGCAAYGVTLLLDQNPQDLLSVAIWFGAGIVVHDGVFAPLATAAGLAGRRILPRRWWAPLAVGAAGTVGLAAVAIPVLGRSGAVAGNTTVLDRDYGLGLASAILVVWAVVGIAELCRPSRITGLRAADRSRPDDPRA